MRPGWPSWQAAESGPSCGSALERPGQTAPSPLRGSQRLLMTTWLRCHCEILRPPQPYDELRRANEWAKRRNHSRPRGHSTPQQYLPDEVMCAHGGEPVWQGHRAALTTAAVMPTEGADLAHVWLFSIVPIPRTAVQRGPLRRP